MTHCTPNGRTYSRATGLDERTVLPLTTPNAESAALEYWSEEVARVLRDSVSRRSNETELREDAEGVIRDALHALYGLRLDAITAETNTLAPGGGRSPVDKIYGGVLVEYEWEMDNARRRHGAKQALEYLRNLTRTTQSDAPFTAIVCDGRQWGFLVEDPAEEADLFHSPPVHPDDFFEWRLNDAASARRFLLVCGTHSKAPVNGRALANAFGTGSLAARRLITLMAVALDGRSQDDRADTLFREWSRSTEIVYGSLDSASGDFTQALRDQFDVPSHVCRALPELLFVIHTYFSFVARLMAVEVLAIGFEERDSQPSTWSSLSDAELTDRIRRFDAGELPSALQIQNLFETDVFSWFPPHLSGDPDLLNAARDVLDRLTGFAFPRVTYGAQRATDNLRELYQNMIPRALRKLLGEYPTPSWLAEASLVQLQRAGAPMTDGRVLDPTCGTGAFLLPLLRSRLSRLRSTRGDAASATDVQTVLDSLAGFDINPIAVTATRANFIVALGDLAALGPLRLPIWRTDSLVVPEPLPAQAQVAELRLQGQDYVRLETSLAEPFAIPSRFKSLGQLGALRAAIERALDDPDDAASAALFSYLVNATLAPGTSLALTQDEAEFVADSGVLDVLFEHIRELHRQGRDGVWGRIIENSFAPLFAGRFAVVVGNPPWLGWPKLPERWRDRAARLWKRFGLWSTPKKPTEHLKPFAQFNDIATLVFATALGRYAAPDGYVGFLVPEALIVADPGARAFRQYHLKSEQGESGVDVPFAILSCDNWKRIKPFGADAANNPIFLVAQRDRHASWPVPTRQWRRALPGARLTHNDWAQLRAEVSAVEGESRPVDPEHPYSAWSFSPLGVELLAGGSNAWNFGMGANTRGAAGVYYVDVLDTAASRGEVKIRNKPAEGRRPGITPRTRFVEASLVHPMLRGRDIDAWSAVPSGFMVVPQDPDDFSKPLTDVELRRRFPKMEHWLRGFASVLRARTSPNSSWEMTGRDWCRVQGAFEHADGAFLVVVPEQRMPPPAALVGSVYQPSLGRRAVAMPNHKVVFCSVPSFDEGLYLVACINSTHMQLLLESFASSTAVAPTTLSRLPIPRFDASNSDVAVIVAASRAIHVAVDKIAERDIQQPIIDTAVQRLLITAPLLPPAPSRRASIRRKSQTSDEQFQLGLDGITLVLGDDPNASKPGSPSVG